MGFLLYILNVFLWISLYAGHFSHEMRDKLGMYFYIKDSTAEDPVIYKDIMNLKDELEAVGLEVVFSSKEDAFLFLQERVPEVVDSFEKYGIENPLPATLYVMFDNEQEYQALRSTIATYKNLILNIKDIDQWATLKQQENRILSIINMTNMVQFVGYVLIVVLSVVFLFFLAFLLEHIFQRFRKDLVIKKLLWATPTQISQSFVWMSALVLVSAFVLAFVLVLISAIFAHHYVSALFGVSVFGYIWTHIGAFLMLVLVELSLLVGSGVGVSMWFVKSLHKKI